MQKQHAGFVGEPERRLQLFGEILPGVTLHFFGGWVSKIYFLEYGYLASIAELAHAPLAAGRSLDQAAERLGIARNTARSHLRGLFAKTGVSRQGELVRLIHTSLPGLAGEN